MSAPLQGQGRLRKTGSPADCKSRSITCVLQNGDKAHLFVSVVTALQIGSTSSQEEGAAWTE